MLNTRKRLYNKVSHIRRQVSRLFDELEALCPEELGARGPIDPNDEYGAAWREVITELSDAFVAILDLTGELDPSPPIDDDF